MLSKRYKKYGWANSLPEIPESEITETIYTDVVVCGAGFAGCSTACRSSENGLDVVVLEKGPTYSARGLHLGVADSKVMRSYGIKNNLEDLAVEWVHFSASRADERLINLFLHRSGEAMDWLLEKCDKHGITYDLYAGQYNGRSYKEYFGTHTFSVGVFGVVKMLLDERVPPEKILYHIAASTACKAAIKDGYYLDEITASELAAKALRLPDPHCPHGRPVFTAFTKDDLFALVRRTQ